MSRLRDIGGADLARLRIAAAEFLDTPLYAALKSYIERDRTWVDETLANPDVPMEKLKYAQGVLAQVKRDIMLVENFMDALAREQDRRQRSEGRQ